ncbi:hypothetical protein BC936DRAFT_149758 [Jimgerdemannia flammicorona]|uniref:Uncharacterized protein n=2 Tax=Jimgerdemannia flammicorona TaxID=994334 RepID=A0A433Q5Z7_9FUNG|nr:hypothetical protein BC936DRAFT_149758 [Jimgerdemannia flammicorona]RUS25198.1 hypothetical protein BC938DRAFT_472497 [Jimgerdemannia flammicorona]
MKPLSHITTRTKQRRSSAGDLNNAPLLSPVSPVSPVSPHGDSPSDDQKMLTRNIVDRIPLSPIQELPITADPRDKRVLDIEACIDHPHLAPLGGHVIPEISKSATAEQDRPIQDAPTNTMIVGSPFRTVSLIASLAVSSHSTSQDPTSSLVLRRRRLNTAELERHIVQYTAFQASPTNLVDLDISRNRITTLPANVFSFTPHLRSLNLSSNLLSNFPPELLELTKLEVLLLSQNKIGGPMPEQFPLCLSQLRTLRLDANSIATLPDTISNWRHLRQLTLGSIYGGNRIAFIPNGCISEMHDLVELNISHNLLRHLPCDIGHPASNLVILYALDNQLESIPCTIGLCSRLRSLNLSRNHLTSLPMDLVDLRQLDTLDVSCNLLCILPNDIVEHMENTTLLLTGNPFTRPGNCDLRGTEHEENSYGSVIRQLAKRAIATRVEYEHLPADGTGGTSTPLDDDSRIDHHLYLQAQQRNMGWSSRPSTPGVGSVPTTPRSSSPFNPPRPLPLEDPHHSAKLRDLPTLSFDPATANPSPDLVPSLRELAARVILEDAIPVPAKCMPPSLVAYLLPGARPCALCARPYVKEWVSSVQVKGYKGYPAIVRRVRFCSARCWKECAESAAADIIDPGALEVKDGERIVMRVNEAHEPATPSPSPLVPTLSTRHHGLHHRVLTKSVSAHDPPPISSRVLAPSLSLTPSSHGTTPPPLGASPCLHKPIVMPTVKHPKPNRPSWRFLCMTPEPMEREEVVERPVEEAREGVREGWLGVAGLRICGVADKAARV